MMAQTSPSKFVREVRQEGSRVVWPTVKETTTTSIMVFIMVAIMAVFFVLVDLGLSSLISAILGL